MIIMAGDVESKADALNLNDDPFSVPWEVVPPKDPREMLAQLSSLVVVFDDGSVCRTIP
jgi:hypothetical protein